MTGDGLADELPTGAILALCDKVLGEVGRRSHRFAWLRAPGQVADAWLPVEAYYPRHRLVVICHAEPTPYDHLFAQLIPQHGLRLLEFAPAALGADPAVAEQLLRRKIARLPPVVAPERVEPRARPIRVPAPRRRSPEAEESAPRDTARPRERDRNRGLPSVSLPSLAGIGGSRRGASTPAAATAPAPRTLPHEPGRGPAPRLVAAPAKARLAPRGAPSSRGRTAHGSESVAVAVVFGLALAVICGAELVIAVIVVGLDSGRLVLGLGIAFDACARVLGTLDSERVGKTGWVWACAIAGSPAVVAAALVWPRPRRPGRMSGPGDIPTEAAPLAAMMATLALVCVVVGLLT